MYAALATCCWTATLAVAVDVPNDAGAAATPTVEVPRAEHHLPNAQSVAFSPDGRFVAGGFGGPGRAQTRVAPATGRVVVWEAATGRVVRWWPEHGDILRVAFDKDGRSLAYTRIYTPGDSVDDDKFVVVDVDSGDVLHERPSMAQFAVAAEANLIVVDERRPPKLVAYDLAKFEPQWSLDAPYAQAVAVSPDAAVVAAVHSTPPRAAAPAVRTRTLSVFRRADDARLELDSTDFADCRQIALSADVKLVATENNDGVVRLWDAVSLAKVAERPVGFEGHVQPVFAADGELLVGTQPRARGDDTACLVAWLGRPAWEIKRTWLLADGGFATWYARFQGSAAPERNPARFAVSPDGKFLLVGASGLSLVEIATGRVVRRFDMTAE